MNILYFLVLVSQTVCFDLDEELAEDVIFGDDSNFLQSGIFGGDQIEIDEAPYMAQVLENGEQVCGATIISEYWLLTAAHCVAILNNPSILTGSGIRHQGGNNYTIARIVLHDKFDYKSIAHDIALVQVENHIHFNELQHAIEISKSLPIIGDLISISGFGTQKLHRPPSVTLQSAVVPIIEHHECTKNFPPESKEHAREFFENIFCASTEDADTCQGDDGGPVVLHETLVGITSFGLNCGSSKAPSIYTSVYNYLGWIQDITGLELL